MTQRIARQLKRSEPSELRLPEPHVHDSASVTAPVPAARQDSATPPSPTPESPPQFEPPLGHDFASISTEPRDPAAEPDLATVDAPPTDPLVDPMSPLPPSPVSQSLLRWDAPNEQEQGPLTPTSAPFVLQAMLQVNAPGDPYEQEADRVASAVMAADDDTKIATLPASGIQRSSDNAGIAVTPEVEASVARRQGGGAPLPEDERNFFEPRMGADFGHVRIHEEPDMARLLNARAFTVGPDIAFDTGEYQPGTDAGRALLAHELTHVVQQEGVQQIQRQSATDSPLPEISERGGVPLAPEVRLLFEQALGKPLGQVLIHLGPQADEAARKMGTQAFTVGTHIYFADGYFAPGTPPGDRLLAHELMHVMQHESGRTPAGTGKGPVSDPSEPLEQEAYGSEDEIVARLAQLRGADPAAAQAAAGPPAVTPLPPAEQPDDAYPAPPKEAIQQQLVEPVGTKRPELDPSSDTPAAPTPVAAKVALAEPQLTAQAQPPPQLDHAQAALPPAQSIAETPIVQPAQPMLPPTPQQQVAEIQAASIPHELVPPRTVELPLEVVPTGDQAALEDEEDGTALAASEAVSISAEASAIASSLDTAKQAAVTCVQGEVARYLEQVHTESNQVKVTVQVAYQEQQATVQAQTSIALTEIETTRASQLATIDACATNQKDRFTTAYTTQREETIRFVENLRQEILAAGANESQRLLLGSEERANAIISEANGQSFSGSGDLANAQQQTTHDIAQKAARECRTVGHDVAGQIQQEATQQAQEYDQPLQDYLAQLEKSYQETNQAVDELVATTQQHVEQAAQQAVQAVQTTQNQTLAALEQNSSAALQQIDAWALQTATAIEQGGLQVITNLEPQVASFCAQISDYGASAASQLHSVEMPVASDVAAFAAHTRQGLHTNQDAAQSALATWEADATTELNTVFEGQRPFLTTSAEAQCVTAQQIGVGSIDAIQEAVSGVTTGLETLKNNLQTELTAAIDNALKEIANGDQKFRADFTRPHQEALKALAKKVDDALASEDTTLNSARSEMASAVSEIASKYDALTAEGERRNQDTQATPQGRVYRFLSGLWNAFTGWVESVKQWFKQTFGDFWGGLLFGIISTLVVVLVGVAVIALVALVSKVAAVVLAVVLIVGAIGLMIYNRFQEYNAAHGGKGPGFWAGLGLVTLGILDITGIPYIIEGIVGKTFTGLDLSTFDRGERIGAGLVMLVTFVVQTVKLIRSMRAPEAKSVIRPPSGLVENPNRPGSWGKFDGRGGRFREYWRYDQAEPGKPGWGGKDHVHHYGGKDHLPPDTPFDPDAPYPGE